MSKVSRSHRLLASASLAILLLASAAGSGRAQIPTTDASVIPQLAQVAQTLSQQLAQIQQFQGQIQATIRTLGSLGSLPQQLLGQLMSQLDPMHGVSAWSIPEQSCPLDSCGEFLKDSAFRGTGRPSVPQPPSSPDFEAQRAYVESRFFSPTDLDVQGRQQILDERARAARAAARDGYAMALAARGRLARASQDADRVIQAGASGTTLREDIQRLSAVMMAIYQERQQQLALYAALLEVEGAAAIAAEANVVSPYARAQGQPQRVGTASPSSARDGALPDRPGSPAVSAPPAAPPPREPTSGAQPPAPVVQAPAPVVQAPAPVVQAPAPVVQAPVPAPIAPPSLPLLGSSDGPTNPYTEILNTPIMIAP